MANFSFVDHVGDGSTTTFPFSFVGQGKGYINESDVKVFVSDVEVLYNLSGENQVTLFTAPVSGSVVRIRRIMDKDLPYADFSRGNSFTQDLLNKSFLQTLYVYHEFLDGFLDSNPYEFKDGIVVRGSAEFYGGLKSYTEALVNEDVLNYQQTLAVIQQAFVDFTGDPSGSDVTLRLDINPITSKYLFYRGADITGLTDSTSYFQEVGDTDGIIFLNGGTFLIQGQVNYNNPVSIVGPGRLIIDWNTIGGGKPCFTFNGKGSSVQSFGEPIQVDAASIPVVFIEDIEQVVFKANCDDPSFKTISFGKGHYNCIRSVKSDAKISIWGITGIGLLDGLTNNTAVHTLINISDGQGGSVSNWRGEGFCHSVLFDLSTNRVGVSYGEAVNCANHAVYISSGDDCHISHVNAYGPHTDIKARGHGITASYCNVYGGSLALTNRVAEAGNGYSTWGLKIDTCHVDCTRLNAIPVEIGARTGFDTFPARDCGISNTTVTMSANTSDGVRLMFYGLEDCYIDKTSFKTVGAAVVSDGIKMQPTDGVTSSRNIGGKVTACNSKGVAAQAYQLVGDGMKLAASDGKSAGGTGGNSGCALLRGDNVSVSSGCNLQVTTGGIPVIRHTAGNNLIVANNVLRRGDAATSHIVTTATTSILTPNIEVNA